MLAFGFVDSRFCWGWWPLAVEAMAYGVTYDEWLAFFCWTIRCCAVIGFRGFGNWLHYYVRVGRRRLCY